MRRLMGALAMVLVALYLIGGPRLDAQACTTTISAGANLGTAVSGAANGSTVCLNAGSYPGPWDFGDISKSSTVTIRSTTGSGVSIGGLTLYRTSNLTWDGLDFSSVMISDFGSTPRTNGLVFKNSTFSSQLRINVAGNVISNTITIGPGNTFSGYSSTGGLEGMVYPEMNGASGTATLLITGNTFDGSGTCSDGVQVGGSVDNVTISRNVFKNKQQGACTPHVDAIQQVGGSDNVIVEENFFTDNCINIGYYDGGTNGVIRNNIFDGGGVNCGGSNDQPIQIGGFVGMTYEHNTHYNFGGSISFGTKNGDPVNSGWTVQNNIFDNASQIAGGDQPGCGASCVMRYNLKSNGGSTSPTGTNIVTGTAVYSGTRSTEADWANWLLAGGSPGKAAGNDGFDMGTVYYGSGAAPQAPSLSNGRARYGRRGF